MGPWWRRLIRRGSKAVDRRPWPLIPYTPILMLFLWGSALRLSGSPHPPADLQDAIPNHAYIGWLISGATGPPLAVLAWWLITQRDGIQRYRGLWVRLGADILCFTYVAAFHLAVVLNMPSSEARIFSRYCVGSILVFLLCAVGRDIWALAITERVARRLHRGRGV